MNTLTLLLNTVSAASEVSSDSLTIAVVGAVVVSVQGIFGFLLRHVFTSVTSGLANVDAKLDKALSALSAHDTARAVTETRIAQMERDLAEMKRKHEAELADLRRELRELSEGIAR